MLNDLLFRLRSLFRRDAVEAELDEELRFHFEQQVEKYVQSGSTREEARRQARLAFGGLDQVKEECRESRGVQFIETFLQDVRYSLRTLGKTPGFTAVAVLTLALGMGACTAIFSAVNPILFEPLPYPHASRLMMIWYAGSDGSRFPQAFHNYRELAERSRSFDSFAVMKPWLPALTGENQPERLEGQQVSADYFRTLAVAPVLGRDFQASDDVRNGPKVVILSDGLWRRVFGGDRAILGQQVKLDDNNYTVIGIMPPTLENVLAPSAEVWSPLQYDTGNITTPKLENGVIICGWWGGCVQVWGRIKRGANSTSSRTLRWRNFPGPVGVLSKTG